MAFVDRIKKMVTDNRERIESAVDSATQRLDRRTGGRYRTRLESGAEKVKGLTRRLDEGDERADANPSDPEPLAADAGDVTDALPGGLGQPSTRPGEADAPVPPG